MPCIILHLLRLRNTLQLQTLWIRPREAAGWLASLCPSVALVCVAAGQLEGSSWADSDPHALLVQGPLNSNRDPVGKNCSFPVHLVWTDPFRFDPAGQMKSQWAQYHVLAGPAWLEGEQTSTHMVSFQRRWRHPDASPCSPFTHMSVIRILCFPSLPEISP